MNQMERMTAIYDAVVSKKGKRITAEDIARNTSIEYKQVLVLVRLMMKSYTTQFPNLRKRTVRKNTFFTNGAMTTTKGYQRTIIDLRIKE